MLSGVKEYGRPTYQAGENEYLSAPCHIMLELIVWQLLPQHPGAPWMLPSAPHEKFVQEVSDHEQEKP
ncbi:MAG: hypothetical protein DRH37_05375 [Deltaproteobacteria bacterium]|nr:MAG: hypothetical protein B5M55_03815 [Desulfococcus sp. 4484_242]RLC30444.1 MAG: hypothetical protein DRH37_05375 [Deltaproteobacteria bacterium]